MNIPSWMAAAMEETLNRALGMDERASRRARALAGRSVGLEIKGLDIQLFMQFETDRVRISGGNPGPIDAWIRGAPFSLLHVSLTEDRRALRDGDVVIEGNLEFGHAVQRLFRGLDIDWDEQLARVIGDPLAFQIGAAWRRLRERLARDAREGTRDITEYVRDEWGALPFPHEAERWYSDVDRVRGDADRLAQRLAILERRNKGPSR